LPAGTIFYIFFLSLSWACWLVYTDGDIGRRTAAGCNQTGRIVWHTTAAERCALYSHWARFVLYYTEGGYLCWWATQPSAVTFLSVENELIDKGNWNNRSSPPTPGRELWRKKKMKN
jgi:hypothetical protein